jgi:DNA-directed RNA polymerase, mitochondrial
LRRLGYFPDSEVYVAVINGWMASDNLFKAYEVLEKMRRDSRVAPAAVYKPFLNATVRLQQRATMQKVLGVINAKHLPWADFLALGNVSSPAAAADFEARVTARAVDSRTLIKVTTDVNADVDFDEGATAASSLHAQQLSLETRAVERAISRYQKMMRQVTSAGLGAQLKPAQLVLLNWYQPLVRAIKAEQRAVGDRLSALADAAESDGGGAVDEPLSDAASARTSEADDELGKKAAAAAAAAAAESGSPVPFVTEADSVVGPYMMLLSPQALAVIVMHELLGLLLRKTTGVPFANAAIEIGRAVQAEYNIQRFKSERGVAYSYLNRNQQAVTKSVVNRLSRQLDMGEWDRSVTTKLGSALIALALQYCKIRSDLQSYGRNSDAAAAAAAADEFSAFQHLYVVERGKRRGHLRAHENVYKLIDAGHRLRETLNARHLPMVVPPIDWSDVEKGGYLQSPTLVMRTRGSQAQREKLMRADLTQIYAALNALGRTPWRINRGVYDVARQAWAAGGGIADLPLREDVTVPTKADDFDTLDARAQKAHHASVRLAQKTNAERHSLRCDTTLKLQVAQELLPKTIYMPHNLDFRGRAYPIPPHLNHIGSDLCRGLLWFDEARPLGPVGLRWLKIHLANVYGKNKLPFDERIAWTEAHLADVDDSCARPLNGRGWWLDGEEPWQVLATCFELNAALKSGDPHSYLSRLPVHQDGTCNGLQHYAALGGDRFGARQVNLEPGDRPQDVYSGVAELVRARVAADAAAGNELAKKLDGHVDRKIVKQTVMTSVYGVTFVGANLQILARVRDARIVTDEEERQASTYLTRLTFGALREMFLGARTIMEWLATCAQTIAKNGQAVSWTTPLGLPVVQPYRKPASVQQVRTIVQTVVLAGRDDELPVNTARQTSATAPNFVHSLDSTHMLLTARACEQAGVTFASVHDSFWTHASTIPDMARLLRREFVDLHSQPILEHLREEWLASNPGITLPPVPKRGDLDLRVVLGSPYFFS